MTLSAATPDLAELNRMIARYAPAELKVGTSKLSPGDQQALKKLLDAAQVIDNIFLEQRWSGNQALREKLVKDTSPLGKARLHYFDLNKGPWSELDDQTAFLPDVPARKPLGANFYPEALTKQQFEAWVSGLPIAQQEQARGFFTRIGGIIAATGTLQHLTPVITPYSAAYEESLTRAAKLLEEAAALTPIRVVNEVLATGDGAHGVRTAAFNLPNDERIVRAMGSKRVMLKNIQEAKFSKILEPIAARVLSPADRKNLSFDAFFTHILAHEMTHGIGPQNNVRQKLKELHSAIEEAKADVTGLFMLQYLFDKKLMPAAEQSLYTTFLASSFRTLRFGVHEAHGKGMALQFNYLSDKGAFVAKPDGTFAVDFSKIQPAVRDLVHDLLDIEATGDYARAKKMLDELGIIRPALEKALDRLKDIPTDIEPIRSP